MAEVGVTPRSAELHRHFLIICSSASSCLSSSAADQGESVLVYAMFTLFLPPAEIGGKAAPSW